MTSKVYSFDADQDEALHLYTLQAYQAQAARTAKHHRDRIMRLYVAVLGLLSEAGEIASELKHAVEQEREIDMQNIREEVADCQWYLADMCSGQGWSLAEVAHENIAKLQRRYPTGFSPELSIARKDKEA